jgi:hypothetical protein
MSLKLAYSNSDTLRNVHKEQPRISGSYSAALIGTLVSTTSFRNSHPDGKRWVHFPWFFKTIHTFLPVIVSHLQ